MKYVRLTLLRNLLFISLALILLLSSVGPVAAQDAGPLPQTASLTADYLPGRLVVRLTEGVSINATSRLLAAYGAQYQGTIYGSPVQIWQVPEGQELALALQISADAEVLYAEPDYLYAAFDTIPNDENYAKQWAHTKTRAPKAWDVTTGATNIVIAVVDTGVDTGHPDLSGKLVSGYDVYNNDANPLDDNGHGTHVSGIAAATTNNGTGVAGVSWGARVMPVKALAQDGSGPNSTITGGINWAYQHGADIINLSLGGTAYSQAMQEAVNNAHAAGSLVVAAMGNNRTSGNPTMYPAALDNVFAVSSTGPTDVYAPYSQYGNHCDIAAPGGAMSYYHDPAGIYSTMPTYTVYMTSAYSYYKNYDYLHGTSQASPYVAGLAALVWSLVPGLTPDEVQMVIEDTAIDLGTPGWDVNYGHGRVDAYSAIAALQIVPDPPSLAAISNADGDGNYTVDWNDVALTDGYVLQEDDSPIFASPLEFIVQPESQYSIAGRGPGTWYYRVKAVNLAGTSAWSNARSTTVKPNAPVLSAITNPSNLDAYTLTWSAASAASGYLLQEDDNGAFSSPTTRYQGTQLSYNVTGQPSGTWYYRVQAYNAGGNSAWSTSRSTTVGAHLLLPPSLQPIINLEQQATFSLTWGTPSEALITYTLEQSRDIYFSHPQEIYAGSAKTYSPTVPTAGTWYFRVRAFANPNDSAWSVTQSTQVMGYTRLPLVVENLDTPHAPAWETLLAESFENDFPGSVWALSDSSGAGDGEYFWSQADCQAQNGSLSGWGFGDGAGGSGLICGDDYPDGAKSWMTAGPFDLSDAESAELSYDRWLYLQSGTTADPTLEYDWLCYMLSSTGLSFKGYCYSGDSDGWKETLINLPAEYLGLEQVWVGFFFTTDASIHYAEGAYVDDVLLRKCTANCPLTTQDAFRENGLPLEIELRP